MVSLYQQPLIEYYVSKKRTSPKPLFDAFIKLIILLAVQAYWYYKDIFLNNYNSYFQGRIMPVSSPVPS